MNAVAFNMFLWNIKKKSLAEDKLFLIEKAAKTWFFTPNQISDIAACLSHSADKKCTIKLLIQRLVGTFNTISASQLIKRAVFSKDRIEIFKMLLPHSDIPLNMRIIKTFVDKTFDTVKERVEVLRILKSFFKETGDDFEKQIDSILEQNSENKLDSTAAIIEEERAKTKPTTYHNFYDCPTITKSRLLNDLATDPETKSNIQNKITHRIDQDQRYLIPSNVSSILIHLRPGSNDRLAVSPRKARFVDSYKLEKIRQIRLSALIDQEHRDLEDRISCDMKNRPASVMIPTTYNKLAYGQQNGADNKILMEQSNGSALFFNNTTENSANRSKKSKNVSFDEKEDARSENSKTKEEADDRISVNKMENDSLDTTRNAGKPRCKSSRAKQILKYFSGHNKYNNAQVK